MNTSVIIEPKPMIFVIPAQVGIQFVAQISWIPACAGMTDILRLHRSLHAEMELEAFRFECSHAAALALSLGPSPTSGRGEMRFPLPLAGEGGPKGRERERRQEIATDISVFISMKNALFAAPSQSSCGNGITASKRLFWIPSYAGMTFFFVNTHPDSALPAQAGIRFIHQFSRFRPPKKPNAITLSKARI